MRIIKFTAMEEGSLLHWSGQIRRRTARRCAVYFCRASYLQWPAQVMETVVLLVRRRMAENSGTDLEAFAHLLDVLRRSVGYSKHGEVRAIGVGVDG